MIEIDLNIESQGLTDFPVNVVLSGQVYQLRFRWSVRSNAWFMDIGNIVRSIKLVNGIDLIAPYRYIDTMPQGTLGVHRNKGTDSKPAFFNLGIDKAMTLIYEE